MEYLIVAVLTVFIVYWFGFRAKEKERVVDVFVDHGPLDYFVTYDPAMDGGNGSMSLSNMSSKRISLVMATPTLTRYNNGEVSTAKIQLDSDFYVPGDLISIDSKLTLLIKSEAREFMGHFYYITVPVGILHYEYFNFVKPGTIVYRLHRELTESEKAYLLKNKIDVDIHTTKFKDFNPPYKPHKYGGTTNNLSSYDDSLVRDILLNPISPVSIWHDSSSDWNDGSFPSNISPAKSDYDSGSSNDSSSSYDSGDSGSSDCGGGDSGD